MLLFLSVFMLPLIAALVAGDIVAAEDGNGTLKTILTRSVDRGQVFAAKALAAMTYAAIAVFLSADRGNRRRRGLVGLQPRRHASPAPWCPRPKVCCWCSPPTPAT